MIYTNRCKHCNKTKEEHILSIYCAPIAEYRFCDSGLSSLDAHKEELYDRLREIIDTYKIEHAGFAIQSAIDAGEEILKQIEKEK